MGTLNSELDTYTHYMIIHGYYMCTSNISIGETEERFTLKHYECLRSMYMDSESSTPNTTSV